MSIYVAPDSDPDPGSACVSMWLLTIGSACVSMWILTVLQIRVVHVNLASDNAPDPGCACEFSF
jgi:hypothetical protein